MRIKFFLSDNEMAPTTISDKLYAKALIRRGYDIEIVNTLSRKKEILSSEEADMIIFQKKIHPGHTYADIKHLKGKVILIHIDDDFEGMNNMNYLNTLKISDLLLVCNQIHAEKMKTYIKTPVEVIAHISDFENYPFKNTDEKNNTPLVICWQQNLADVYIEDLLSVSEPLQKIYNKYKIDLRLYGWHEGKHYGMPDRRPEIQKVLPFAKLISFVPNEIYLKQVVPEISKSDIGIIPYVLTEQRASKSSYSLKKMMMMGIPMVVSNFGSNAQIIEDGINGYLANSVEEWYTKIETLILDKNKRKEFAFRSRAKLEKEFAYEETVDLFIKAIEKHFSLSK